MSDFKVRTGSTTVMASITTHSCILLFTAVVVFVSGGEAEHSLRCYVCESETYSEACENSADVAIIASADCSSLVYPARREENERSIIDQTLSSGVDGKFRGRPLLDDIFLGTKNEARSSPIFNYMCLKVTFVSGDKRGTTRTCAKVPSTIKDTCEFIRNSADPQVEVKSCAACDTDNCNSGSLVYISTLTIPFSVLVALFRR